MWFITLLLLLLSPFLPVFEFFFSIHPLKNGEKLSLPSSSLAADSIKPKKQKPNIFFVLVDDLGWGNVDFTSKLHVQETKAFYGNQFENSVEMLRRKREITESSSFLSSLAEDGRILERHYTHCTR